MAALSLRPPQYPGRTPVANIAAMIEAVHAFNGTR
jgi:hypothetical protein